MFKNQNDGSNDSESGMGTQNDENQSGSSYSR
jgi:hypothetical protein